MIIYTIKQLIKSNVHLGHYKWESDYKLVYFLLGIRNSIHIINIYNTLYILKCLLYNIYNLGLINQRVLVVNNVNFPLKSKADELNKKRIWYLSKKWVGGLLTNQRDLYVYNEKLFLRYYKTGFRALLPSLVFVSNIEKSSSCIYEAIVLNILNSSLFDTNLGLYGIFYKLCSNDDNYGVMVLFSKILVKTYIKSIYDKAKIWIKSTLAIRTRALAKLQVKLELAKRMVKKIKKPNFLKDSFMELKLFYNILDKLKEYEYFDSNCKKNKSSIDLAFYKSRKRSWWKSKSRRLNKYQYQEDFFKNFLRSSLFESDISKIGGSFSAYKRYLKVRNFKNKF